MSPYNKYILRALLSLLIANNSFAYQSFGRDGRDGLDGRNGMSGNSGQSVEILATGQPVYLNLDGQDGGDGSDGQHGEDAYSCEQPMQSEENLEGADGGDGGDGGNGGNGGDGGNITVYTNNVANLRNVTVSARPGEGGRPARGGYGGRECLCMIPSWTVTKCDIVTLPDGTKKEECRSSSYSCTSGRRGSDKSMGYSGSDGRLGELTLIPQTSKLLADRDHLNVSLAQVNGSVITLEKNLWARKSGAQLLLAPGSYISDSYNEFLRRASASVILAYEFSRPQAELAGAVFTLQQRQDVVEVKMPENLLYQAREEAVGGVRKITIEKAVLKSEAENLGLKISGRGTDLKAEITDLQNISDLVGTSFHVYLEKKKLFGDKPLFDGAFPAQLIEKNGNVFTLKLGQIPGIDPKYLKKNANLELRVRVARSLAATATEKAFREKFEIK